MTNSDRNQAADDAALTSSLYWDEQWRAIRLPYLVNPNTYWWSTFIRLFERSLADRPRTVLEVGCGACEWLIYFERRYAARSFGVDYSSVGCQVGARNLELAGCAGRLVRGDVRALPFAPASFDLVFSLGVVEHFEQYAELIRAMAALVRPGGCLLTTVPNFGGWIGVARRHQDPATSSMHLKIREPNLQTAYDHAGLVDVEIGHFGSFRIPYQPVPPIRGLGSGIRAVPVAAGRLLDKALVAGYRVTGRSIESEWLSSGLYALGRRPDSRSDDGALPSRLS